MYQKNIRYWILPDLGKRGQQLIAIEVKSGKTIHTDFFKSLDQFKGIKPDVSNFLVYGGKESQKRSQVTVVSLNDLHTI